MGEKIDNKTAFLAKIGLLITAILWGSSLTVVKMTSETFNPNFILAIRFTVACLILLVIFWKKISTSSKEDIRNGLIIGLFLFVAYSSQTIGVGYADPGRSAFLSASYCVIVPFLSWIMIKKRPDKYNMMAAVLAVIGIFLISMFSGDGGGFGLPESKEALLGDGLALLSGVLFAAHIVVVSILGKDRDPIRMTVFQFMSAAVVSWIVTLTLEDNSNIVLNSARPLYELLYLAVMCTTVALLLQNIGQRYTDESSAAIILGLESVFGIVIPVALGMEKLTVTSVIGFALVFAAIMVSETKLSFLKKGGQEAVGEK